MQVMKATVTLDLYTAILDMSDSQLVTEAKRTGFVTNLEKSVVEFDANGWNATGKLEEGR